MAEPNEANRYHVKKSWLESLDDALAWAPDKDLEKWAHDPNCIEMEECAKTLARRRQLNDPAVQEAAGQAAMEAEQQRRSEVRKELEDNPFDPRTEVSADAIHIASRIVKHLWIIFVLLPFVAALSWAIVIAVQSSGTTPR
jgi:hypothetical protein